MAHGFRHIPKDRQHTPEYYRRPARIYDPALRPTLQAMPIIKFEPFEVIPRTSLEQWPWQSPRGARSAAHGSSRSGPG